MNIPNIRNSVTIVATAVAVIFIIASTIWPDYAVLILSIELVLLPSIYIVGNTYIEDALKREYDATIAQMQKELHERSIRIENANAPKETDLQEYDLLVKHLSARGRS